jgi:hypothetical protein
MKQYGRKGGKPPERIMVADKFYKLSVLMIHSKNSDGSPGLCKLIPDDQTVHLAGGEEFMTCYVPEVMFQEGKE